MRIRDVAIGLNMPICMPVKAFEHTLQIRKDLPQGNDSEVKRPSGIVFKRPLKTFSVEARGLWGLLVSC